MAKVFISYAREDIVVAKKLYSDLTNSGYDPWLDQEDLLPGQEWESEIKSVIDNCSIFIPLVSKNSASKRGFYQGEIRHAFDVSKYMAPGQVFIIPARLDNYDASKHPFFSHLNFADLHPDYNNGYKKINLALRSSIGRPESGSNKNNFNKLKDNITLHFPLKVNIDDVSKNSKETDIVVCKKNSMPRLHDDGLFFDGSFVVQAKHDNLPLKQSARTVCVWMKFLNNIPLKDNGDTPKFVFSYGEEEHGKAFGLFYGMPFFDAAKSCNYGLRIFTWCHPFLYEAGLTNCDSEAFSTAILSNWYHVCISFDGYTQKAFINGELYLSEDREYETGDSDLLNIGGFLPNREVKYNLFNFEGYLREFIMFDKVLSKEEINDVYTSTRKLL